MSTNNIIVVIVVLIIVIIITRWRLSSEKSLARIALGFSIADGMCARYVDADKWAVH